MKNVIGFIGVALMATLLAFPANAAFYCYGGGSAGYTVSETELSLDAVPAPSGIIVVDGISGSGGNVGLKLGCDVEHNRWVIGGWTDYTWQDADFEVSSSLLPATVAKASIGNQFAIGGRLGYKVTEKTLVYGLIGWTKVQMDDLEVPVLNASFSVPDTEGLIVGGGLEVELLPNVVLGGEYRYADLDSVDINIAPGFAKINADPDVHQFKVNLTYKMNITR